MKNFMKEFRDFAVKGNVIDLAVWVIIGAAFGKIVTSIVEDLVMPVVGKMIWNVDFSNLYIPLSDKITEWMSLAQAKAIGPVIAYGNFITVLINFLIIAFCIFLVVKALMKAMPKKKEEPKPKWPTDVELLTEIRDLLKDEKKDHKKEK